MVQDNTTTIEIRLDQRDALQDRKQHDRESYKSVLDRLLADTDEPNDDADELVDAIATEIDTAAFNGAISDEQAERILRRLDDLETAIPRKTAEELQR